MVFYIPPPPCQTRKNILTYCISILKKTKAQRNDDDFVYRQKRRENHCEKELIDRVIFEKEPPKKK